MVTASGTTPETIGLGTTEPPFAVTPRPDTLFAKRAERFRALSPGHELRPYLEFLAVVGDAQHALATSLPPPPASAADQDRALAHGMPPLARRDLATDPAAAALFDALIAALARASLEAGPRAAIKSLAAASPEQRGELMGFVAEGEFPVEALAESAIAAAALQVWFAAAAATLDANRLKGVEEGLCPACGGAPGASLVVGWRGVSGSRYLVCAFCATAWNYVRVKCSSCAATKGISYRRIAEGRQDSAAEVCEACGCYAKHLIQLDTPAIDAVADDIASFGLDVLLREEGWRRASLNPFFLG
jgi:FdhE protein